MPRFDLSSGAAKIRYAMEKLQLVWADTADEWDDQVSRRFAENHLDPIAPSLKNALDAVSRMERLIEQAERECGSRE